MVTFSGILYITLENSLIFTRSHAFYLEKNNLGAPTQAEFVFPRNCILLTNAYYSVRREKYFSVVRNKIQESGFLKV